MKPGLIFTLVLIGFCGTAEAAVFECKRTDAPQTVYLKIDDAAKGALIADDAKTAMSAPAQPAGDFSAIGVSFKQFVKYDFDRISSTLTQKSIGVTDTFKCARMP